MRILTVILLLLSINLTAQVDSAVLTFDQFMDRVKNHHPLAKQADLTVNQGKASLKSARGSFDPKVYSDVSQKYFSEKQYYSVINSGLKIPTWYGIEIGGGYTQNDGIFLNPQNNTSAAGLWSAGISVPIGQGLFIDKRRAVLKQAKIYQQSTLAERDALYNQLLLNAGEAYWKWFENYNTVIVYRNAVQVTNQRYEAVKQGALFGDKPPIDTVEAAIQLQNRLLNLQEAELAFKNASALLSIFLWEDGVIPIGIPETTHPHLQEEISVVAVDESMNKALDSLSLYHPTLRQYGYKIDQLKIEKRWKQEQIKPQINLKYNAITEPVGNDVFANYNTNNYIWGVTFNSPIFLRKERGNLELAKLKVDAAEMEIASKRAEINYKAIAALNDLEYTGIQLELYARTVSDYSRLLEGEKKMFDAGESSLFMVNSRELGYINTQLKYIKLLTKNHKASLKANFALGILK